MSQQTFDIFQYLVVHAKFPSPEPVRSENSLGCSDVSEVEVAALDNDWKPITARFDNQMVDCLLSALGVYFKNNPVPAEITQEQQAVIFSSIVGISWKTNNNEAQARYMVRAGNVNALLFIMMLLGNEIRIIDEAQPTRAEKLDGRMSNKRITGEKTDFKSKVDFCILSDTDKILVEVKSVSVMEAAIRNLLKRSFRIHMKPGGTLHAKVVNKICLYMASHKSNWLALTCHDSWVFFRLHNRTPGPGASNVPYITYSEVEKQSDNTRPFRALLAMMLAAQDKFEVESKADLSDFNLATLDEENEDAEGDQNSPNPNSDPGSTFEPDDDCDDPPPSEPRVLQPRKRPNNMNNSVDIKFSWTVRKARTQWFSFSAVEGTSEFPPLGEHPFLLRLQRLLGCGSTGAVYEAKHDIDGDDNTPGVQSYALKIAQKGTTDGEKGAVERLRNEFEIYRVIERARGVGKIRDEVPRCYGLYESRYMLMLVLDYAGSSVEEKWEELKEDDRNEIFNAVKALHSIGIAHNDLEERNVARAADGSYKVFDFSSSEKHKCRGISQRPGLKKGRALCEELKTCYNHLIKFPLKDL